jgi:hypothetical protein
MKCVDLRAVSDDTFLEDKVYGNLFARSLLGALSEKRLIQVVLFPTCRVTPHGGTRTLVGKH